MSAQGIRCVRVPGRSLGIYRGHRQAQTAVVCRDRVAVFDPFRTLDSGGQQTVPLLRAFTRDTVLY